MAQTNDFPRGWQLHRPGAGILVDLPADAATSVVQYSTRISLLVTNEGTSSFDIVNQQTQLLTASAVIAAGGRWMIGRACTGDRCTLTAIDFETSSERVLRTGVSLLDLRAPALSPDGRYFALTGKSPESGRYAEIIDVATSLAAWRSPDGVSFAGVGPAWSWSPDSTRFFVTMSASHVIAVDVRERPFRQTDIAMPHTPLYGIAVTLR